MFQINHTTHSPARMPDAARMGNQEGAGVDNGAGADAGEDDHAGDGGDGRLKIEVMVKVYNYILRCIACFSCMYDICIL